MKKYANMQTEQNKAVIEQIMANREFRRKTLCKESIVMVNLHRNRRRKCWLSRDACGTGCGTTS